MSRVALYLRLSREDTGSVVESESIANQRKFLMEYVHRNGWKVYQVYIDDGFTGTNFNRPGFQKMIEDIEKGWIDTVIVKDLSRLGRDHIDTGYYYERYFPLHGIRFIAVNDQIDTGKEDGGSDTALFKAVFNDMYAKDISKKVCASFQIKRRNGEFIGSSAPYGYCRSSDNKNRLEIDPVTAPIVRLIYRLFLEGKNFSEIARILTQQKIATPSEYKKTAGRAAKIWNGSTVQRILTNPTYAGDLAQNRSRKINYKVKKVKLLPSEQWVVVENTHKGIISKQEFSLVQKRILSCDSRKQQDDSLQFLCAECGKKLGLAYRNGHPYYLCSSYRKQGIASGCSSHCCRKEDLETAVKDALSDFAKGRKEQCYPRKITFSKDGVVDIYLDGE